MQQLSTIMSQDAATIVIWLGIGLALLIGLTIFIWLVTKIFGRSLNMSSASGRGQPQRLAITGAFNVDRKGRKLVIVRRDNVEHLILIGGPNDVVVESGIIRAERSARPAATRDAVDSAEMLAVPPPAPLPVAPPLTSKPAAPVQAQPIAAPPEAVTPPPVLPTPVPVAAPAPRIEQPQAPRKPDIELPAAIKPDVPVSPAAPIIAPEGEFQPPATPRPAQDPRLSDMARRLQNVLQRPLTQAPKAIAPAPAHAAVDASETIPIPLPSVRKPASEAVPAPQPAEPNSSLTQGKPLPVTIQKPESSPIDSLEEEMARLLGRSGPDKV